MSKSQEIQWLLKEKYGGIKTSQAEADIERIKNGEPVAYVIGFVDFLGCKIDLSEHPLIPRPETEFWIEQVINYIGKTCVGKCLDMFAGSGCIGIALLKHLPHVTMDFADIDDKTLKQIEINCKLNGIDSSRYQIIKSDMFEHIGRFYDYIFANPPYIAEDRIDVVQKSVLDHEPHNALFAGPYGLLYIRQFLNQAPSHLNLGGKVYMEFDELQKDAIEKILKPKNFNEINFYKDQFKKWRYLVLEKQ